MARTEEQKRDAYYLKKYGISLVEYEAMLAEQNGVCAICHRPPVNNRLAVEHCHKWKYVQVFTKRGLGVIREGAWVAEATYCGVKFRFDGAKKNVAIRRVRTALQRFSVRGLACFPCNSGLRKFSDDPTRLANASEYLRKHQNG